MTSSSTKKSTDKTKTHRGQQRNQPKKRGAQQHRGRQVASAAPHIDLTMTVPPKLINKMSARLSTQLSRTLVSSSPSDKQQLRNTARFFVDLFWDVTQEELDDLGTSRFDYALDGTLDHLPEGELRQYFVGQAKSAGQVAYELIQPDKPSESKTTETPDTGNNVVQLRPNMPTPASMARRQIHTGNAAS